MRGRRRSTRTRRWALAAISCVVVALVSEGAARLLFPSGLSGPLETRDLFPFLVFDPLLSWRNEPGFRQKELRIGEHGERLVEKPPARSPEPPRALLLGDSRTFGIWLDEHGFRYDADFASRLARLAGARLEVVNAGTIGYTSSQGLRQWMLLDGPIDPGILVVAFGMNDNLPAWNPSYRVSEPRSALLRHMLYQFGDWRWIQAGFWLARSSPWSPARTDWKPWVTLEEYRHNLERFAQESRHRRVRLVFLHLPLRPLSRGENEQLVPGQTDFFATYGVEGLEELHAVHDRFRDVTREVAQSHDVPMLDVSEGFEVFRELHPGEELFSAYDLVHANDRGAELIARLLEKSLVSFGFIAPAGGDGER